VGVEVRVRHRSEGWRAAHGVITPLAGDEVRFGFALSMVLSGNDTADRISRLERHMRRIAQEIEVVGLVSGFDVVPDADSLPGLADLSPRQWEILTRLLRGERVPGIAKELFLSQSTVRNHLSELFRKLGVHSQEELLALLRATIREQSRGGRGLAF
jgi:DNA-binding NarL/FixJ family response regulator